MHQSNNVYLKDDRGGRSVIHQKLNNLMLTDTQIISLAGI